MEKPREKIQKVLSSLARGKRILTAVKSRGIGQTKVGGGKKRQASMEKEKRRDLPDRGQASRGGRFRRKETGYCKLFTGTLDRVFDCHGKKVIQWKKIHRNKKENGGEGP